MLEDTKVFDVWEAENGTDVELNFFSGEECKDALGTLPQTEELHQKDNDTLINQVFKCRCTLKQFLLLANGMIFCICHLPFVVS